MSLIETSTTCPFQWEAVTAVGTVVLAAVGIATLLFVRRQLDDFRRESLIKHLMDLVNEFEHDPIATRRKVLGATRAPGGHLQPLDLNNPPPELHDVMNFFEHMGHLLEGNYLKLEDVSVEFHYWILHIWANARSLIKFEQAENPLYYEYFERMVDRLLKYDRPRTGKLSLPTQAEVEDFYAEESHLAVGSPIPRQRRLKRRSVI